MAPLNQYQANEIAVGCVLVAIAVTAVCLRFYAKLKRKTGIGLDDQLSLVSLALIFTLLVELLIWATVGGNGRHFSTLSPDEITTFFKVFYANEISYVLCTPCIKLCILAFYRRIFTTPKFRLVVMITAGFTILFSLAFVLAAIFQCTPVEAAWNKMLLATVPGSHCFDGNSYFLAFQSINIALDIFMLLLPMPMIWRLQRTWQDKLALTGVFLLGGFVCAASIYRIATLFYITNDDVTFTIYQATVWTFVEPCIGLLCACLPIIRGLFPAFKRHGSRGSSGRASGMKLKNYGFGSKKYGNLSGEAAPEARSWTPEAGSRSVGGDQQGLMKNDAGIHVRTTISVSK